MEIFEIQPKLYQYFKKLVGTDRLSHAYLFSGGFGNKELALYLAKVIFCSKLSKGEACEVCRICRLIDSNDFTDLHIIKPNGQFIKVDQIRELLDCFAMTGFESNKKVIIICEAEKMNDSAANSLLKAVEDPMYETFIFLLTDNEDRILPTIRSRTQVVVFPKNIRFLEIFLQKYGVSPINAALISKIVSSAEEGLQLAKSTWFLEGSKHLKKFVDEAQTKPEDAFLSLTVLSKIFENRMQQEKAFELLLVFFNHARAAQLTQKTFVAQRYWYSNVRFQSALESILL